ncbi:MAG TPA: HEAT repeat domain-containing protein, partial [Longimicrobiaceae bacterium]|nr:HEAT repeat domain-containing protein [Longimicrobiaceae bacterium]
ARAALRLVRTDLHARAVHLLDALVTEAERPDRSRVFRDSAVQALRRVGTEQTLQHLAELLRHPGAERERILRFMVFVGGEAIPLLEGVLFRAGDPDLRREIFRGLLRLEGLAGRVMARALADPSPGRARVILELALLPEVEPEQSIRWVTDAAGHADPTVRMDAAHHAATLGGRGGLRVLVDLLSDRERLVQRAAIEGLGSVADSQSIPFLARLLNETSDEELQVAAVTTLGKVGSAEALPVLLALVNKRSLFASRRVGRVKTAAVAAIARIPSPASRDVLASLAAGRDSDVADEARRALETLG